MYKIARYPLALLFLLIIGYQSSGQLRQVPPGAYKRPLNFQQKAQQRQNRIEQVREIYLGRRLSLSSDESTKFWPVYRQYQDALTAVRQKIRLNTSNTQPDGAEQVQNQLYYEGELVNIRKFYTNEFLKILPPEKVSEMFKAEKEFRDELIKQLRERSQATTTTNPSN